MGGPPSTLFVCDTVVVNIVKVLMHRRGANPPVVSEIAQCQAT